MDTVTVYECVTCEARGQSPETIWHVSTCTSSDETRALVFELGSVSAPLFRAPDEPPG